MVSETKYTNLFLRDASTTDPSSAFAALNGTSGTVAPSATSSKAKKNGQVSKDEFLNLLVTQMKHQDPLNPMDNQEFAVQLAQFSSLEQLVSINDKIGTQGSDSTSMASYLGHSVTLNSDQTSVVDHKGGKVKFSLVNDAFDVKVQLVKSDGSVAETISLGAMNGGNHEVDLQNLQTANGAYSVRVVSKDTTGAETNPEVHMAGVVTGFVPGPSPKLLVNGSSFDPTDILEVSL